jgi:cell division protein FtsB
MEPQTLLNIVLGSASGVLGWFARELWAAVKELKTDIAKLREELPKEYVAKTDFREALHELKSMLNRIFEKLDGKQDK